MSTLLIDETVKPKPKYPTCMACEKATCEGCGNCHTVECRFNGMAVTTPQQYTAHKPMLSKSQKARGYAVLEKYFNNGSYLYVPTPFRVINEEKDAVDALSMMGTNGKLTGSVSHTAYAFDGTLFVRPCPLVPRHGFVESRPITISGQNDHIAVNKVVEIFREARAVDPEAELLVVPTVKAKYNLIVTPTRVAIGPGNDGATSGHDSISIPLAGAKFYGVAQDMYSKAGIDTEKEDPYFEVVIARKPRIIRGDYSRESKYFVTQLRAGAKVPPAVGDDFIPSTITVEQIIHASGDLVEWEKQAKKITPTTVVVHEGGTLISHYGIHCILNNVAIMTSRTPKIGETLEPTIQDIAEPNPAAVIEGLAASVLINLAYDEWEKGETSYKDTLSTLEAVRILLFGLHNSSAMSHSAGFWTGFSCGLMFRLGMMASHGEARHGLDDCGGYPRDQVYEVSAKNFFKVREYLGHANFAFKHLCKSGSIGGPKWQDCTESTIELDRRIRNYLQKQNKQTYKSMLHQLNVVVNKAHNGGWWMNKFVDKSAFDEAASQSFISVLEVAPPMYDVANWYKGVDTKLLEETVKQWTEETDIVEPEKKEDHQYIQFVLDPKAKEAYDKKQKEKQENKYSYASSKPKETCKDENCKIHGKNKVSLEDLVKELWPDGVKHEKSDLQIPEEMKEKSAVEIAEYMAQLKPVVGKPKGAVDTSVKDLTTDSGTAEAKVALDKAKEETANASPFVQSQPHHVSPQMTEGQYLQWKKDQQAYLESMKQWALKNVPS